MKIKQTKEHWGLAPVFLGNGNVEYIDVPIRSFFLTADREEIPVGEFPWLRAMLEDRKEVLDVYFQTKPEGGVEILYSSLGEVPEDFPCEEVLWDLREFCQEAVF